MTVYRLPALVNPYQQPKRTLKQRFWMWINLRRYNIV